MQTQLFTAAAPSPIAYFDAPAEEDDARAFDAGAWEPLPAPPGAAVAAETLFATTRDLLRANEAVTAALAAQKAARVADRAARAAACIAMDAEGITRISTPDDGVIQRVANRTRKVGAVDGVAELEVVAADGVRVVPRPVQPAEAAAPDSGRRVMLLRASRAARENDE